MRSYDQTSVGMGIINQKSLKFDIKSQVSRVNVDFIHLKIVYPEYDFSKKALLFLADAQAY